MEQYLSVVKAGKANLEDIEKSGNFDVQNWPSFLNAAVERGPDYWERYIDVNNHRMTPNYYTRDDNSNYADYLFGMKPDYHGLIGEIGIFSSSPELFEKWHYGYDYTSDQQVFLDRVVMADNIAMMTMFTKKRRCNFHECKFLLRKAINRKATLCTEHIVSKLQTFESQNIGSDVWTLLSYANDHSLTISLERFLRVTAVSAYDADGDNLKIAFLGSAEEVKVMLDKGKIRYRSLIPFVLLSRISYEEAFADILLHYLDGHRYCKSSLESCVIDHNRQPGHTEKIIRASNKREILFPSGGWNLNLDNCTLQALKALFSVKECFVSDVHFEYDFKFAHNLLVENKFEEFKEILMLMLPIMTDSNIAHLFPYMPADLCQLAYKEGFFVDSLKATDILKSSISSGNAVMAAVALKEFERLGNDKEVVEEILGRDEFKKYTNPELYPLLNCWSGATEEQKERFMVDPFGSNYQDVSAVELIYRKVGVSCDLYY